jgi:hypoxanthine-guanine phosphoribosyltransferase
MRRNDHVIIVDDIDKYGIDTKWIKDTLSKHNPFYIFTETKGISSSQLIAYI